MLGTALRSVRTRLALWHTAVLALVLVAFTTATWMFLDGFTRERIDTALAEAVRSFRQAVTAKALAGRTAETAVQEAAREFRFSGRRVLVYGRQHRLIAVSDSSSDALTRAVSAVDPADDSPLHPMFASLAPGTSAYASIAGTDDDVRAYASSVAVAGETFTIVALQVGRVERAVLANFLKSIAIAIPIALALAFLGGRFLARRGFAPVIDMGRRAALIDSEHLNARLVVRHTGDEMDELATIFNDMLGRIERGFAQQRQFMADASHELRTPVASLRAEASVALSRPRNAGEYEESLARVHADARRLSATVDDLFALARLDAEDGIVERREFFLEELLLDRISSLRALAEDRGVSLHFTPSVEARCHGDAALVDRALTNLLDNALKYVPRGGTVRVELETLGDVHAVRVIDDGPGIPPAAQPHVFDRFFRADSARSRPERSSGGAGLGLSIAWRIARAHGGDLALTSSTPGGTTFTLVLPAARQGIPLRTVNLP